MNFFPAETFPGYLSSKTVATISDNCTETVSCELYYEPTWDLYLDAAFTCAEVETKQPCFGTFACVCDNAYYRLSNDMPEAPAGKIPQDLSVSEASKDDGDGGGVEAWHIILIVSGLIVIAVAGVAVFCFIKNKRNSQSII